jgi:hypothetical protein
MHLRSTRLLRGMFETAVATKAIRTGIGAEIKTMLAFLGSKVCPIRHYPCIKIRFPPLAYKLVQCVNQQRF